MILYKANENFELRSVAGEHMLVPNENADFDPGVLLMLNETGSYLWGLLKEVKSSDDLTEAALNKYTDEDGTIASSIREFLTEMVEEGLVIRSEL